MSSAPMKGEMRETLRITRWLWTAACNERTANNGLNNGLTTTATDVIDPSTRSSATRRMVACGRGRQQSG